MRIIRIVSVLVWGMLALCALPAHAQWLTSGNNIYNSNTGNVGIGTTSPTANLHVAGNMSASQAAIGGTLPCCGAVAISNGAGFEIYGVGNGHQVNLFSEGNFIFLAGASKSVHFGSNNVNSQMVLNNGNLGIGTQTPSTKLHVVGDVAVTGNIAAKYQDVAEWVRTAEPIPAGTVVVLDSQKTDQVTWSSVPYDTRVAGVVTDMPGLLLGEPGSDKIKVATTGRVRVKVDATMKPVAIGDLLVTSSKPGVAMPSEAMEINGRRFHQPGTILGKALEPLKGTEGEILVLLSLQ